MIKATRYLAASGILAAAVLLPAPVAAQITWDTCQVSPVEWFDPPIPAFEADDATDALVILGSYVLYCPEQGAALHVITSNDGEGTTVRQGTSVLIPSADGS
jgi:hypothetical protein